ncbi:MAG: hypothetical protein SGI90_11715 [Candidatus Eisenbacteria bacterium]|nr:hypothetical protein [Candidatus Eisenbacteria bacterium]
MRSRVVLGMIGLGSLALVGASFSTMTTGVLTIYGQAWTNKPQVPAGAGFTVRATNVTQGKTMSIVLGTEDDGKYALVFIDTVNNRVATTGDVVEVTLLDTKGNQVGVIAQVTLDGAMINTHLLELDVNPGVVPIELTTWGKIKARF